jgi:polysaccharide export outer membrane protein
MFGSRSLAGSLAALVFVAGVALARADAQAVPGAQQARSAPPIATVAADYRIRPGDDVMLSVFGEPTLSPQQPLKVLPGGTISVPLVGVVSVGGLTTNEASDAVAHKLAKYLRSPKVAISVFAIAPVEALILGNVKTPGKYVLTPPARITDAIAAAGGLGPVDGDFPDARLVEPDGTMRTVSLQKLLHDGDLALNAPLTSGAEVYIPSPDSFDVRVVGAVDKPGDVVLHPGDDLALAIARAGTSTNSNPDLNRVTVTRTGPDGKTTATNVNLYDILKNGDLSRDMTMQKGDLVYVPEASRNKGGFFGDALGLLRRLIFF